MKQTKNSERFYIYLLLIFSGGFMGAYSYILKGGVFANAETANCLQLGYNLAIGNFAKAKMLLFPIGTYFIGSFISELFITYFDNKNFKLSWQSASTYIAALLLFIVGLLPKEAPFVCSHIIITFISAMEFNTFRQSDGLIMSTVFCTAHLRESGVNAAKAIINKDKRFFIPSLKHLAMIISFILGSFFCAQAIKPMQEKAIWGGTIITLIIASALTKRDFKQI